LSRAQIVCLSRADTISPDERAAIRQRVAELAPQAVWCELAHSPSGLVNSAGQTQPLESLRGHRIASFCGIGNPAGFRHTLATTGCDLVAWREFPDHHAYTAADLSALTELAEKSAAELIACTQKDLVKIQQQKLGNEPLWAVAIEMQFLAGREELERALEQICPPP
jgi:tetraacyldisaccharide 4'-kinase